MALQLRHDGPGRGKYAAQVMSWQQPMARAATLTFRDAAKMIQDQGRQRIAAAGFSRRWQTGFQVFGSPRRQFSLSPGLRGFHRIGYANIFERGGTIKGKPLLWLPLSSTPAKIGGKPTTPRLYVQQIGPLHSINRAGKPPLLAGYALRQIAAGRKATVSQLKTGARNAVARRSGGRGRRVVTVPLFVGISTARIARRFDVSAAYARVRPQLGALYLRRIEQQAVA